MHFETDDEWAMSVAKPRDKHAGDKGTLLTQCYFV